MKVNFIKSTTLDWVLFREERIAESGSFGGTSYTDPHVILKRLEIFEEVSIDMGGTETKKYAPGIYRATKGGLAERSKALGC
jgi:hypothetical protein